jgi:predicted N-acetyltransferase YhbS
MRVMDETPRFPIRTATPETVRAFLAPLIVAFGEDLTDAEFDDWRRTIEPDRLIAAFEGDVPIATAGAYTFRLTVPGGDVGAAGVTAVGVEPGHRRQGILRSLMRNQLDDVHDRGEPVAVLWASESAIYQRFGYGLGTLDGTFEIDRGRTAWLRPREPEGRMRLVDEEAASPGRTTGGAGGSSATPSTAGGGRDPSTATSTRWTAAPKATRSTA